MLGTKYLSELVDFNRLYVNVINIIQAPTGSGKTYFALHAIPEHCIDALHKSIYLIDTINGKEQILKNYNALPATRYWIDEAYMGCAWETKNEQVIIMTYALLGCILESKPDFCDKFEYIVCDELHKLIDFQYYSKQPNVHSIAKNGLERTVANNRTVVIALSATPRKIFSGFKNVECQTVLIDQEMLRHYETKNTYTYYNLNKLISALEPDKTGICYTGRIAKMKELSEVAAAAGLNPIAIWSTNNTDHIMSEEQLRVRSVILEEYRIPSEYNFLIINSSSETSIKIKSKVDYVIVNSSEKDIQIQVKGRVDHDLDTLYLPVDAAETSSIIQIPEEFLGKELYSKDKDALCQCLDLKRSGKLVKWNSIKKIIQESDSYNIIEKRKNNLRYAVITKTDNK